MPRPGLIHLLLCLSIIPSMAWTDPGDSAVNPSETPEGLNPEVDLTTADNSDNLYSGQCEFYVKVNDKSDFDKNNYKYTGYGYVEKDKNQFLTTNHQFMNRGKDKYDDLIQVDLNKYKYAYINCKGSKFFVTYNEKLSREPKDDGGGNIAPGTDLAVFDIVKENSEGSITDVTGFSEGQFETVTEPIGKYLSLSNPDGNKTGDQNVNLCRIENVYGHKRLKKVYGLALRAICNKQIAQVSGTPAFLADNNGKVYLSKNGLPIAISLLKTAIGEKVIYFELIKPIIEDLNRLEGQ